MEPFQAGPRYPFFEVTSKATQESAAPSPIRGGREIGPTTTEYTITVNQGREYQRLAVSQEIFNQLKVGDKLERYFRRVDDD